MSNWEFLIFTVMYGDDDQVISVPRNGIKIFSQEKMSVLLRFMDDLKSEGWELAKVTPKHWGQIHNFKRKRD